MSKTNQTTQKAQRTNITITGKTITPQITRTIGGTTYRVSIYFSQTAKESMGDKIVRLIKSEALAG
jgi:uncharacterized protein YajQ (UPF0234 family)